MPYRIGRTLKNLIEPDRRRYNALLLVGGGMIAGSLLTLATSVIVDAIDHRAAHAQPLPQPVPMPLSPQIGTLTVICSPQCGRVILDSSLIGGGDVHNRIVPSGTHLLELVGTNGVRKHAVIDVPAGHLHEERVDMTPTVLATNPSFL
jgi:hypothetical protein